MCVDAVEISNQILQYSIEPSTHEIGNPGIII